VPVSTEGIPVVFKRSAKAEHKEKNIGCIECESAVHHRFPWCDISAQRVSLKTRFPNVAWVLRVPNEGSA